MIFHINVTMFFQQINTNAKIFPSPFQKKITLKLIHYITFKATIIKFLLEPL